MEDIIGKTYGLLTVIEFTGKNNSYHNMFRCICKCGNEKEVRDGHLLSGNTKSCGCLSRSMSSERRYIHGMTGNPTYQVWVDMMKRCNNPDSSSYKNYGARGITVCERWSSFLNFYEDMGDSPYGLQLDRRDNDGQYCPENCRWVTRSANCRNRRNNNNITFNGRTQCLAAWSEELGINPSTLSQRLKRGLKPEEALFKPASSL